jgi:hypothetical protein
MRWRASRGRPRDDALDLPGAVRGLRATDDAVSAAPLVMAAGVLCAAAAGFAVPPREPAPVGATADRGTVLLSPELPAVLAAHLDPDGDGLVPRMDTIAFWGRPRLRLGGSPWLPAVMYSRHRVGHDFASHIDLTWYGRTLLHVVDAYVDGHGMAGPVRRPDLGDEIDQGANLFLWAEAVLIPSAFAAGTRVRAVAEDASTVRLELPLGTGTDTAWLHFDAARPSRFSALRHRGRGSGKVWWHVDMADWWPVAGILLPQTMSATWADEARPWFRLTLDGFAANVDVDPVLDDVAATIHARPPVTAATDGLPRSSAPALHRTGRPGRRRRRCGPR